MLSGKGGKLEEQELPAWTKSTLADIWAQVSEDHEARNDLMRRIRWKSTDFLTHVVGEVEFGFAEAASHGATGAKLDLSSHATVCDRAS